MGKRIESHTRKNKSTISYGEILFFLALFIVGYGLPAWFAYYHATGGNLTWVAGLPFIVQGVLFILLLWGYFFLLMVPLSVLGAAIFGIFIWVVENASPGTARDFRDIN